MPTCDARTLHELLDSVEDTRDVVVPGTLASDADLDRAVWAAARDDASVAWAAWARRPGRDAWVVYLAARDREDAALAALRDLTAR